MSQKKQRVKQTQITPVFGGKVKKVPLTQIKILLKSVRAND